MELANWIYWEENEYYCFSCIEKRLQEVNDNREFSDSIDYDNGETCGFMQDVAYGNHQVECCMCGKDLETVLEQKLKEKEYGII